MCYRTDMPSQVNWTEKTIRAGFYLSADDGAFRDTTENGRFVDTFTFTYVLYNFEYS